MATINSIYRNPQRLKDYKLGYRRAMQAAAHFMDEHRSSANGYRLGDLLLCKFNLTTRKPRKARNAR